MNGYYEWRMQAYENWGKVYCREWPRSSFICSQPFSCSCIVLAVTWIAGFVHSSKLLDLLFNWRLEATKAHSLKLAQGKNSLLSRNVLLLPLWCLSAFQKMPGEKERMAPEKGAAFIGVAQPSPYVVDESTVEDWASCPLWIDIQSAGIAFVCNR